MASLVLDGSPNTSALHMTVHGMQQKSHSISPHGQEMHGFVEPLIGFAIVEITDDAVEEGGMVAAVLEGGLLDGVLKMFKRYE